MRHTPDAVMIFAAGFGTRMKDLTQTRPKPLIEVAGKALIDHALDWVEAAALTHRVANVHYQPDQMIAHLQARGVRISDERSGILETGGGLKYALPLLPDGPVFTMNSDAVFRGQNPFEELKSVWDDIAMDALLLLVPPTKARGSSSAGDFTIDEKGALTRGPGLIYSGVQIIKPACVAEIDSSAFSLNVVWDRMIERGRAFGVLYPGTWCDVGHPAGIGIAEAMLEEPNV